MDSATQHFVAADYVVFGGMLLVSTLIGVFFGIKDRVQSGAANFLTAEGKIGVVPVALSMLASFLSSITLIGQPAEVFLYGFQLIYVGISSLVAIPIVGYFFVPFFQEKKYLSAYHYFGERFGKSLQFISSVLFTVLTVLYLALVLYAPALAIHQVTGIDTILIVSIMYLVCLFYTTIGGMKAVVWTDSFQVVVLYLALFAILIKGTIDVGGLSVVWSANAAYKRTNIFDWNMDPTVRYTTWSAFFGSAFLHLSFYGGNQVQIQRYLTVRTPAQARKMLWINIVGWTLVVFLTVYAGLLIFTYYINCNPFESKKVTIPDELFPVYVMETFSNLPGFSGLFLAGVFSAGLSTVSAGVNSLAALWINELRGWTQLDGTWDKRSGTIAKILSFSFGVVSFLLVFVVPYLGGLAPVAISLAGIFTGSLFGVFVLGMFFPSANNAGAMSGLLGSIGLLMWMATGSLIFEPPSVDAYTKLQIGTTGCRKYTKRDNSTFVDQYDDFSRILNQSSEFSIYRISFLWYPMLACVLTLFFGLTVSAITNCGNMNNQVEEEERSPRNVDKKEIRRPDATGENGCAKPFTLARSLTGAGCNGIHEPNWTSSPYTRRIPLILAAKEKIAEDVNSESAFADHLPTFDPAGGAKLLHEAENGKFLSNLDLQQQV